MEYKPDEGWEYEDHPCYATVKEKCDEIIQSLSSNMSLLDGFILDTRETHKEMYLQVTPDGCEYFAGNYRGARYPYLSDYQVSIAGHLGAEPHLVESYMINFAAEVTHQFLKFQQIIKTTTDSAGQKLIQYCDFIAHFYAKFLIIHPYANGNGHIARILVWCLLKKENLTQNFWSIDSRPGLPPGVPLDQCIELYRQGKKEPLIAYFLLGIQSGRVVTIDTMQSVFG